MDWSSFVNFSGKEVVGGSYAFGIVILIAIIVLLLVLWKKKVIGKGFGITVITVFTIFILYWSLWGIHYCEITPIELAKAANTSNFWSSNIWFSWNWVRGNVLGCGEVLGWGGRILYSVGKALGFEQTMGDFFFDFGVGALAGIFLWLMFHLAYQSEKLSQILRLKASGVVSLPGGDSLGKLKRGWLAMIASGVIPWKAVIIGAFYAVLLQIPFIKVVVEVLTFKSILGVSLGVGWIIRAILIAFYIGLLPTAIEAYSRYKTKQAAYKRLLEIKMGIKSARTMGAS